jgi:hypothetical protein
LKGIIQARSWFLVQEAAGSGTGAALPVPDAVGTIALSSTAGKVLLADTVGSLGTACPTGLHVVDLVGWGAATCFKGSGPAAATSNTTAAVRKDSSMSGFGDNSLDFQSRSPLPRNGATIPLPVQLISFVADRQASGVVLLRWTTVSEIDNFGFYIDWRGDSSSAFAPLPGAFIGGHGTSLARNEYAYADSSRRSFSEYKLRQVDRNGAALYFGPVRVSGTTGIRTSYAGFSALKLSAFPNPWNPSATVEFSVAGASDVVVAVYDVLGRNVRTLFANNAEGGRIYRLTLDGETLGSGVYFVRMTAGEQSRTVRCVLTR